MSNASNKKPKGDIILVASGDQALLATGALVDPATNALNIANGQLGAMVSTHTSSTRAFGDMLQAGDVVPDVDSIQIVQGTPYSSNYTQVQPISAIDHKEVVKSHKINAKNGIVFSASVAKLGSQDAWVIGNTAAATGEIPVQSEADYKLNVQFVSVRNDRDFGAHGEEDLTVPFSTPDYVALSTTAPLDHLVQNLVFNANLNSAGLNFTNPAVRRGNKNFIAFAINTAGGAGTALSAVSAGTPIDVVVDSSGATLTFTPDAEFEQAVTDIIAEGTLAAASTIELVDLSTAGAAAKTDSILLVSLDDQTAFAKDEIPQTKVRLRVGLEFSFVAATKPRKVNVSKPYEGKGQGRKWKIQYDKRYGLNIYTAQNRSQGRDFYIIPPSYIDESLNYSAYIIQHYDTYKVPASHTSKYFYRTIILVPCNIATGATAATTLASLNAVLGPWLQSAYDLNLVEGSYPKVGNVAGDPAPDLGGGTPFV